MDIINYFRKHEKLHFRKSQKFYWDSKNNLIYYDPSKLEDDAGRQSLLHEIGHALLGHLDYKFDLELLKMEIDAWKIAKLHSKTFNVIITKSCVDDSLNSYLNWIKDRAICPACSSLSLQNKKAQRNCAFCYFMW